MGFFLCSRDWSTCQDRRKNGWGKILSILEENLLFSARKLSMGRRFTFQHDNESKHTAKLTTQWLKEKKVNILAWLSQSHASLSSSHNLWNDLKTAVHKWSPSNVTELEQFCKEEWSNIAKLVETYPNRLKAVIKAKGGSTKY